MQGWVSGWGIFEGTQRNLSFRFRSHGTWSKTGGPRVVKVKAKKLHGFFTMTVDTLFSDDIFGPSLVTSNHSQVKVSNSFGWLRHLFFDNLVDNLLLNSWSDLSGFDFSKL